MPLVSRWGSEVLTEPPLESSPSDPKPVTLENRPSPDRLPAALPKVALSSKTPKPLGRTLVHPFVLPDPPAVGLDIGSATIIAKPASGLDISAADILPPVNGLDIDSTLQTINSPASGLDISAAEILPPSNGLDIDDAVIPPPASGLDVSSASEVFFPPAQGLDLTDAVIIPPANGLDLNDAGIAPPVNGLDIDVAAQLFTLNIDIVSDQTFADDPSSGSAGDIKYSSDVEFIFIHNGTEWHRINGGNS